MIPLTLNNKEYLLVEVPEDAYSFSNSTVGHQIDYLQYTAGMNFQDAVILREYWGQQFEIISLVKDLTEEQAASMVEWWYAGRWHEKRYRNYQDELSPFKTALESFSSFLRSHGVDETRNYLILVKI